MKAELILFTSELHRKLCACSICKQYIAAPSNGVHYKHCYNCGAEFVHPVTAMDIRNRKRAK